MYCGFGGGGGHLKKKNPPFLTQTVLAMMNKFQFSAFVHINEANM